MQRKPQRPASDMRHLMKKTHRGGGATTALCHTTETKSGARTMYADAVVCVMR